MGERSAPERAVLWLFDRAAEGIWQAVVAAMIGGSSVSAIFKGVTHWPWLIYGCAGLAFVAFFNFLGYRARRLQRERPLVVDLEGKGAFRDDPMRSCRAFRIYNRSPNSTLAEVKVMLERCEQQDANFYPIFLQRSDGGTQPFSLNPREHMFVMLICLRSGALEYELAYEHTSPYARANTIRKGLLNLHVSISARNVPAEVHELVVNVDPTGQTLLPLQIHVSSLTLEDLRSS